MNLLNSFILMKRAGDKARQAEQLLAQEDLTDDDKLRKILLMGDANLVIQSGAQNFKLLMFLSKKEVVKKLVKYALAVPTEDADEDEAYKFPNVAQEYLTKSPMLLQSIVNGGQVEKQKQSNYDDSDEDDSEEEFGTDEENEKKEDLGATIAPKGKKALQIQLDDDDDEDERDDEDKKEEQDDEEESAKNAVEDILSKHMKDEEDEGEEDELEERDEDAEEEENKENSQDAQKKDEDDDKDTKKKGLKFQAKKIKKSSTQQAESPQDPDVEKKEDDEEKKVSVDKAMLQMGDDFSKTNRAAKSRNKQEANDDEDEFERDDDQTELEGHNKDIPEQKTSLLDLNDDDDAREDIDDDDDDSGNKAAKSLSNAKKTVEVYMPEKSKKKKKVKKQQEVPEPTQAEKNLLLDMVFSFIGVCSQPDKLKDFQRESLNLFASTCKQSRMTAGTTTEMPGKTQYHDDFKQNAGTIEQRTETPELLSVSCGYFKNIVMKMMFPVKRMEVLRYMLVETNGAIFDKLLYYSNSQYSLASLLMELMQWDLSEGNNSWPYDDEDKDEEAKKKQEEEKAEKAEISKLLDAKKADIVGKLITKLSHANKTDMEASLSSSQILIDLVEIEKTLDIFFANDAKYLRQIIDLAADCENKNNQAYLLHVLLTLAKQLKPDTNKSRLQANDKNSDDDGTETERSPQNMFDKELPVNAKTLKFLQLVHEANLLNYLIMMLSSDNEEKYENQYQIVPKFGQIRLRSLELIHCILVLLYPSKNKFAHCMRNFVQQTQGSVDEENKAADEMDNADHPFSLARFLPNLLKRHLVQKLLNVLLNYGYCSIACQLCVQIMVQISGQYDIIDVANLQRFVIEEFRQRHVQLEELTRRARQREATVQNEDVTEAGSTIASQAGNVAPKKINHMNMQSAQVNQMTMQLKERVELVQQFYEGKDKSQAYELTGSDLLYSDLITTAELKYWKMLCRKDFKRLQKLMTQEMGQGHFVDDSDEFNSDSEDKHERKPGHNIDTDDDLDRQKEDLFALMYENNRRRSVVSHNESADGQKGTDDDDDSFDQESFLENMLAEMRKKDDKTEEAELRKKAKEMEEKLEQERKLEEQKYADNNFWRIGIQSDLNVEDLLADLDDDVPQTAASSEPKVEDAEPEVKTPAPEVDGAFVDDLLNAFEDDD